MSKKSKTNLKPYIICTGANGRCVLIGLMEPKHAVAGRQTYKMKEAQMLVKWGAECGGLLGFAANGPKGSTRISPLVPKVCGSEGIKQVIEITEEVRQQCLAWKSKW